MKKFQALALAAALAVSAPAFAQETEATQNFQDFLSGFNTDSFTETLDILDTATSVSIITVSTFADADAASLSEALTPVQQDIDALRARVAQSQVASQALEAAGYTADQVVAISASADGAVTLYVNDLAIDGDVDVDAEVEAEVEPAPAG